jgi:hypothetical protein
MRKGKTVISVLFIVVLIVVFYVLSPLVVQEVSTGHLRSVFAQQDAIFAEPIASLGITGQPSTDLQCIDELHTHWQTQVICQDFASYPYVSSSISQTASNAYPKNAAKFDELLKQNGWVPDRPHDPIVSLAASNPSLPQNGGLGGSVPFHKNIGAISCNLEIDFQGLSEPIDPGSINVNDFGCQQTITYFMPHLSAWQSSGP